MLRNKSSVAKKQRAKLSAEFKAKVALAALCEDKALVQLCAEFQVHSTQITQWERLLVERGASDFTAGDGANRQSAVHVVPPHAKIGELTLENDFLRECAHQGGTAERKMIIAGHFCVARQFFAKVKHSRELSAKPPAGDHAAD